MRRSKSLSSILWPGLASAMIGLLAISSSAQAHCDTMDGPVVKDAQAALAKGDVTPVLKWVREQDEPAVREAFGKTLSVRTKGEDARDLADHYFFETLVRLHRAGEGEPYTGLKPAGTDPGPAVTAADRALASGTVDALVDQVSRQVQEGIRQRFQHALEARQHADDNVAAGRRYVQTYVQYVHYVEQLAQAAAASAAHHHAEPSAPPAHDHAAPPANTAPEPVADHHEH